MGWVYVDDYDDPNDPLLKQAEFYEREVKRLQGVDPFGISEFFTGDQASYRRRANKARQEYHRKKLEKAKQDHGYGCPHCHPR